MDLLGVSKDTAVRELAGPDLQKQKYNGRDQAGGSRMSLHDATQMRRKILPFRSARDRITW